MTSNHKDPSTMTNKDPELLPCQVSDAMLNNATPDQINRANLAVERNMIGEGEPRYGSAQGYACALTAIIQTDTAMNTASTIPTDGDAVQTFLDELDGWEQAYPLSAFPEPDLAKAAALLKAGGMTLDAIGASNMRHVVSKIAPSARAALSIQTISGKGMREAAIAVGSALDDWIKLIGLDGNWTRPPTHDEAQEAMRANNVLAALVDQGERG